MVTAPETNEDRLEVREAHHRMMNVLTALQVNFLRKFSGFSDQGVREATTQFESQILAAGALLQAISSAGSTEHVAVEFYFARLGRVLSRAILSPANIGCEIFSDQGRLPAGVCQRLGFILVELVFNASKYAFAGRNNGAVRIEMTRSGRHWRCTVSDNGVGMNGADQGTGLNIVDALVRSLKGRLIIRSGVSGTYACVILPDHSIQRGHGSAQHGSAQDAIAVPYASADSARPAQACR